MEVAKVVAMLVERIDLSGLPPICKKNLHLLQGLGLDPLRQKEDHTPLTTTTKLLNYYYNN